MTDNKKDDKALKILVEIVSCELKPHDNVITDLSKTKLYDVCCVCKQSSKEVHRTSYIRKTIEPIWTIKTKSLFLLRTTISKLKSGLMFDILHDPGLLALGKIAKSSSYYTFGSIVIPYETIISCGRKRLEFDVKPSDFSRDNGICPKLALRFDIATEKEEEFMNQFENQSLKKHETMKENFIKATKMKTVKFSQTKRDKNDRSIELFQVKPFPDPNNINETEYMTKDQMNERCMERTHEWVEGGSGNVGNVYLEILKCDNLPNKDKIANFSILNDVSDPFVIVVYEDAVYRTQTLYNCLSPRWMPWTQRAFVMPIAYPNSPIYIGIFDHDPNEMLNDTLGRIAIDTSKFYSNTEYLLTYDLYTDPIVRAKGSHGTITIRLYISLGDEKDKLRVTTSPRFLINVDEQKVFDMIRYTCRGEVNETKPSLAMITERANEIMSYADVLALAVDTVIRVLLWRGHIHLLVPKQSKRYWVLSKIELYDESIDKNPDDSFEKVAIWMPIHSFVFHVSGVFVAEHLSLLPSFLCFSLVWISLTIMYRGSRNPDPWKRTKSLNDVIKVYLSIKSPKKHSIEPFANKESIETYELLRSLKIQRFKDRFWSTIYALLAYKRKYMYSKADDIAIETEDKSWNMLENKLYYIHLPLYYLSIALRQLSMILTWKLPKQSFLLTFFTFLAGIVFLFIDWKKLVTWTLRITFWSYGPWMKIIDDWYIKRHYGTDRKLKKIKAISTDYSVFDAVFQSKKLLDMKQRSKLAREDAAKLKAMRRERFGKFSQAVLPDISSKYRDSPRSESSAKPINPDDYKNLKITYIGGQYLEGSMIHKISDSHSKD